MVDIFVGRVIDKPVSSYQLIIMKNNVLIYHTQLCSDINPSHIIEL